LFENFIAVPLPDATMSKTASVANMFSACSILQYEAMMKSQYGLLKYARCLPIALARLYSGIVHHGRKTVKFPYQCIEMAQRKKKHTVLLHNLWAGVQFRSRPSSVHTLATDCLSFVLRICIPKLDIASAQMQNISPVERTTMRRLTDLWDLLGLTLKHSSEVSVPGSKASAFVMDPPIEDLVVFGAEESREHKNANPLHRLGNTAKALLARELAKRHKLDGENGEGFTMATHKKSDAEKQAGKPGDYVPSDRWKVCLDDPSETTEGTAAEGQGENEKRKISEVAKPPNAGAFLRGAGAAQSKRRRTNRGANKSAVVFKFKAGFTNAVRRPVLLKDLL